MTFAYSEYLFNNLMLPVFAVAFIAFPVFSMLIRVIRQLAKGESIDFGDARSVILFILLIVVAAILINILLHGGIHLIYERSGDAVTVQGTVEAIEANSIFEGPQYTVNGERSNGYQLTIDSVTCIAMARGDLEVGDKVTVTYMPNSGFVLSIAEVTS